MDSIEQPKPDLLPDVTNMRLCFDPDYLVDFLPIKELPDPSEDCNRANYKTNQLKIVKEIKTRTSRFATQTIVEKAQFIMPKLANFVSTAWKQQVSALRICCSLITADETAQHGIPSKQMAPTLQTTQVNRH